MRTKNFPFQATLKALVSVTSVLLFAAVAGFGQQQINLTAGPTTLTLPDGTTVPMWGYSCGTAVTGSTATCANLNLNAPAATLTTPAGWSPVVITVPFVPAGTSLTINLTNNLVFQPPTPAGGTAPPPNAVPTSLVIVGQLGGGLGTTATSTPSPDHSGAQAATTWPIAGGTGGTPPTQGRRVQSFAGEVTAVAAGTAATCAAPSAVPATGCVALTWSALRPGTYLIESGTHPSIQGPMGLYGILVVTTAPVGTTAGTAYPAVGTTSAVTYNAEADLLFSEIDPVQNTAVNAAVTTAGSSETMVWSGQPGGCGNPSSTIYHQCYPPAVNYTPLYYLINGVAFDKTHAAYSVFPVVPATGVTAGTGQVLVRLVNAGLRMHVPMIVGAQTGTAAASGFSLIAEDGNPLPGVPRVQSEVFMAAGKTYDVMINAPAASTTALPVYDRELSLSGNATARDAGMLAYLSVNGAGLPVAQGTGVFAAAVARPDTYNSVVTCTSTPCAPVVVSDPGKGVIANDTNVNGVQLLTAPTGGTLTLNANGTFTYVPNVGTASDSFVYCANGAVTAGVCASGLTATVTLGGATVEAASGIACSLPTPTYRSNVATTLSIKPPGVLAFCKDAAGYPLTIAATPAPTLAGGTVAMDPNGGFTASVGGAGTYNLTFSPQNSQGTVGASATASLLFSAPSNLAVIVKDPKSGAIVTDYRWIIEEDRTFYINPACTTNPPPAGCPNISTGTDQVVPTFGTNFHTSYMPLVATGCTGTLSCESGQTLLGVPAVCDVGNGVCRTTA